MLIMQNYYFTEQDSMRQIKAIRPALAASSSWEIPSRFLSSLIFWPNLIRICLLIKIKILTGFTIGEWQTAFYIL